MARLDDEAASGAEAAPDLAQHGPVPFVTRVAQRAAEAENAVEGTGSERDLAVVVPNQPRPVRRAPPASRLVELRD